MTNGLTLDMMRKARDEMMREPTEAELQAEARWLDRVVAFYAGEITYSELWGLDDQ